MPGVYNRASYLTEKRRALELWGALVATLVEGRTNTVVSLLQNTLGSRRLTWCGILVFVAGQLDLLERPLLNVVSL